MIVYICYIFLIWLFSETAQDRFVPHESVDHFIEKNNRNRVKSQAIYKECKFNLELQRISITFTYELL